MRPMQIASRIARIADGVFVPPRPGRLCSFSSVIDARWVALALLLASGCSDSFDPRYDTPAATYRTFSDAVTAGDVGSVWECYSPSYRELTYGGSIETWQRLWPEKREALHRDVSEREIIDEREINDRIAYLLFDTSGMSSDSPTPAYYYFLRESEGWKITTYLDSVFHHELEQAIESGQYAVPQ